MKTFLPFLIMSLLMIDSLSGQVKIGDSPQTLHPASVLELESDSKVLVITRVTDAQMMAINPLKGALVYNIDHDCLHYYNGNQWINICESLDNSFTVSTRADFLRQTFDDVLDSTVVVTPSVVDGVPNLNFEVNVINSRNIAQRAVSNSKIQFGAIENLHIQNGTISPTKFSDGSNIGDLHRWNGDSWVLTNESDIQITEKQDLEDVLQLDPSAGNQNIINLLDPVNAQDAATRGYVDSELLNAINVSDAADLDMDSTNELITDIGMVGGTITLTEAGTDHVVNLLSWDTGNNLGSGTDGGLFLDQGAIDVDFDDTNATLGVTDVQGAIEALAASNADDEDTDDTNELITDTSFTAGTLTVTEAGTDHVINLLSGDTGNNIISGTDGGLFLDQGAIDVDFDDTTASLGETKVQGAIDELANRNVTNSTDIATNAAALILKENLSNKSNSGTLISPNPSEDYPTVQAVKTYVDTVTEVIVLAEKVVGDPLNPNPGEYTVNDPLIEEDSIIQLTVEGQTAPTIIQLTNQEDEAFSVIIYSWDGSNFVPSDANWHYIVVRP